jgi:hypothetical protein
MSESDMVERNSSIGREIWPERYTVRAEINYRDRRGKSATLQVTHFQPDMSEEESGKLLFQLGYTPGVEGYKNLLSQAKDTFSKKQAEALVNYLNKRKGTRAYLKPALKPFPAVIGASAIPSLPSFRDRSIYRLELEPGYDLDFKVDAINMKTYINLAHLFQELRQQEQDTQK